MRKDTNAIIDEEMSKLKQVTEKKRIDTRKRLTYYRFKWL